MRPMKWGGKPALRRTFAYLGAFLGVLVISLAILILGFGNRIINRYGRAQAEQAFAKANPGWVMRIAELDYTATANRLVARTVTLIATNTTVRIDRIALTGVDWLRLPWGSAVLTNALAGASVDATNLDVVFRQAQYQIHCTRLRASVPASEVIADGTELRTPAGDEAFFAARKADDEFMQFAWFALRTGVMDIISH